MTCDIFIRSYWRDFPWLEYCIKAIERYCHDFNEVVVVIPENSRPWLSRHPGILGNSRLEIDRNYSDDYLGQQVTKLHADTFSQADLICHIDSDCIISRPIQPEDIAPGGIPRVYTRPIAALPRHWPWTQPTQEFLECNVSHDFLQYPPFTFPKWLYPLLRTWTSETKGTSLEDWIMSRPARGFSEFNALAAYAYIHYRDKFIWTRATDMGEAEQCCKWFWSWGGLNDSIRHDIEETIKSEAAYDHP